MSNATNTAVSQGTSQAATTVRKAGRPVDPNSNMTRARAIYASMTASAPKEVKAEFVSKLTARDGNPITKETANTYYYMIKREQNS